MSITNCDEDTSVFNGLAELEIVIDQPVTRVWHHWLDMGAWVISHHIEEISELRRTVGAITRVSFKRAAELGYPPPHHHYCKIIKIDPERRYVIKTYSEKGGSYGNVTTAFDDARFFDIGGKKTKVTFAFFGEMRALAGGSAVEPRRDGTLLSSKSLDTSADGMMRNLENLKRIVENQRSD